MSVSGSPQQDPVGALVQDHCMRISCARWLCQDLSPGSCRTICRRSPSTLYNFTTIPHSVRLTHALGRGFHFEIRKRNLTCIPRTRRTRSPQRVARRNQTTQLYLHSAHSTRTISAKGCTWKSENATLPAFCAMDTHDLRLPRKTQSFEWHTPANVLATSTKYCACHDFHNVPDSLHLPRKLTFLTSTAEDFLAPAMQNEVHVRKRTRTPAKTMPSKFRNCDFRAANFVRACAVGINIESQNGILAQTKPPAQSAYPDRIRPVYSYRKNPSVWHTVWGKNILQHSKIMLINISIDKQH